jgi:Cupin-like domain
MPRSTQVMKSVSADKFHSRGVAASHSSSYRRLEWDDACQEWLAESLMKGIAPRRIAAILSRRGISRSRTTRSIQQITRNPLFRAGGKLFQKQCFLLSLAEALSLQYRQSEYAATFARSRRLGPGEFFRDYYFANRPVVIRGLMRGWKALRLWAPDYFAREFGKHTIEISGRRNSSPDYERNFDAHRCKMSMAEFVGSIGVETNDIYICGKNNLLARSPFRPLLAHFNWPKGFMNPEFPKRDARLWFGPKGTVTPLHHDGCNALFGQIYGRKRVKLISPFDVNHLYNEQCFTSVDLEKIDYEKFPLMRQVYVLDVVLRPGEFLFIPIGWWHWVKALDVSISLTLTNFCVQGQPARWNWRYGD